VGGEVAESHADAQIPCIEIAEEVVMGDVAVPRHEPSSRIIRESRAGQPESSRREHRVGVHHGLISQMHAGVAVLECVAQDHEILAMKHRAGEFFRGAAKLYLKVLGYRSGLDTVKHIP